MQKNQIENLVDSKIEDYYKKGMSYQEVVSQISEAMSRMLAVMEKDGISAIEFEAAEWESQASSRVRYYSHYVRHCRLRLADLEWMLEGEAIFPDLGSAGLFGLAKLRRRLAGY